MSDRPEPDVSKQGLFQPPRAIYQMAMEQPDQLQRANRSLTTIKILLVVIVVIALGAIAMWVVQSDKQAAREGRPDDCWTIGCQEDAKQVLFERLRRAAYM